MLITKENLKTAFTFDDVLLVPAYSEILPHEVNVEITLTKGIDLKIPLLSAAMDTVTEAKTAMTMAREGGLGVIHKNMSIESQVKEVKKVKKSESGIISSPITISPEATVMDALELMHKNAISGIPVTDKNNKLVGIITNRDLRFETDFSKLVGSLMTKDLVTVTENCTMEEAKKLLHKHRIEKLLIVDSEGELSGLITTKDIENKEKYPNAAKDLKGRLIVGTAISPAADGIERAEALIKAGSDILVLDSAHGHSKNVVDRVRELKRRYPEQPIIAGNIVTVEAAVALMNAGADVLKVGIGPGSICTTRIVAGIGFPQLTAVNQVAEAAAKRGVTVIADGGIRFSGDIVKALAGGATAVMMGSMFAGTDEAPGDIVLYQGRSFKTYRGMGSIGAMTKGSKDRYFQENIDDQSKFVPEGIEGRVPYKGPLSNTIYQLIGGLKSGMGYLGASNIENLRKNANFVQITNAGFNESHVHDVMITKESPNYRMN